MTLLAPTRAHIASRIGAGLLGSYAFVWGFVSLGIVIGVALGMSYGEAQTLLFMLAFLVFLAAFFGAFCTASVARAWAALVLSGATMSGLAWLLSRALVS